MRLIANYYRREPAQTRRLISNLALSALKTDRVGRAFLAQTLRSRSASRHRRVHQRRRIRRAILKPSEQQLPIGN